MKIVKSPLRFPGGKQRLVKTLITYVDGDAKEYREPFVGGGSLFLAVRSLYPHMSVWINDNNVDIYRFWLDLRDKPDYVRQKIIEWKSLDDKRALFNEMMWEKKFDEEDRGVRFFYINRNAFGGDFQKGGYSFDAETAGFTDSAIQRLFAVIPLMEGVKITNLDYSALFDDDYTGVLYCDPPYTGYKLFYRRMRQFDHDALFQRLAESKARWFLSLDASDEAFALIRRYGFHYAEVVTAYTIKKRKTSELIIYGASYAELPRAVEI